MSIRELARSVGGWVCDPWLADGTSRTQFDVPEPIPEPRSVRAAHGTHILRVVRMSARQHWEAW
jgi:hypothetical protein